LNTGSFVFLLIATILFAVVRYSIWSGKTLGVAFRSRFIARRRQEPALYWASLTIFSVAGAFLVFVVLATRR